MGGKNRESFLLGQVVGGMGLLTRNVEGRAAERGVLGGLGGGGGHRSQSLQFCMFLDVQLLFCN